ncbi:MAG: DUF3180 family protein [Aeromicrobium sp.]|uniref:DUF3180 family protein n=1 Tax=Aeromicrobium sp. TaxID=1871063 RepID=UPI0039E710DE
MTSGPQRPPQVQVPPTSVRLLAVVLCLGLALGALVPAVVRRLGGEVPVLSWAPMWLLLAASVTVGVLARVVWRAVHQDHQRVTADRALFHLVLARASSRVGMGLAGAYGGFALAYLRVVETAHGRDRVVHGVAAGLAALLLAAAGLLLERACRLPANGDDGESGPSAKAVRPTPA